jgi:type II secretory pathway pseudopilin PulG
MSTRIRRGFTLFQLLVVLALLVLLLAMLLPAVQRVREAAARAQSMNNIKMLAIALHNYNDALGRLPAGVDDNGFSATARLLPYFEQDALYKKIDFTKKIDDKANAPARAMRINELENPRDPVGQVKKEYGPTNYLFNHLVFYLNSRASIPGSFPDGTSNTIVIGETLKGDGGTKAQDVRRQYVLLKADALKGLKDDAGVKHFKDDTNIAGDRCASWMDGRFLQGTFNGRLRPNDKRPDVSCAGAGGVSALRSLERVVVVGMCDGSARPVKDTISHTTWKAAITPDGCEVLGSDWSD